MAGAGVAVIGLGYVGLPLAARAVECGLTVIGVDVSRVVVDGLRAGRSHVDDISDAQVQRMLDQGFRPLLTDDAPTADVHVICVPTPLGADGGPDLTAVRSAGAWIARKLKPGALVILESTSYPGTTEDVLLPILQESGLQGGRDFHLAFSPERIDPGRSTHSYRTVPKVVGGLTPACRDAAVAFYSPLVDTVITTRGLREAEMAKLLENTYRHINIALVNEMARFCHELDIDLWDVIAAAKSKPFGFQAFYPGPGVGGHCIPIDPNYLSYQVQAKLGYPFRFVELAQEINAGMPSYVVRRIQDALNDEGKALRGSRILLLGVTYKPDIADQRESPAKPIAIELRDKGAHVEFHDPHVTTWRLGAESLTCVDNLDVALESADLVVLLQNHSAYDVDRILASAPRLFDTRGTTSGPKVVRL